LSSLALEPWALTPDLWIEAQRQLFTGAPGLNSLSTARDQGSSLI